MRINGLHGRFKDLFRFSQAGRVPAASTWKPESEHTRFPAWRWRQQRRRKRLTMVSSTCARIALPPVGGAEHLDLAGAGIAGGLDACSDAAQVGYAVAHHAPVDQHVLGILQPVAEVMAKDAAFGPGKGAGQRGVPPDMRDIDGDAHIRRADAVAVGQRFGLGEPAGAVAAEHRIEGFQREGDTCASHVVAKGGGVEGKGGVVGRKVTHRAAP